MASFKISKGLEANLPTTKVDGAMYFCTDTGNLYIDYQDGNSVSRKIVNKNEMEELISGAVNSMREYTDNKTTYYAVCETPAATAIKTIPIPDGFELKAGAMVIVKFKYANTASSPSLKVGSTEAKPMYRYGTTKISTGSTTTGWSAGSVQIFIYDENGWIRLL